MRLTGLLLRLGTRNMLHTRQRKQISGSVASRNRSAERVTVPPSRQSSRSTALIASASTSARTGLWLWNTWSRPLLR